MNANSKDTSELSLEGAHTLIEAMACAVEAAEDRISKLAAEKSEKPDAYYSLASEQYTLEALRQRVVADLDRLLCDAFEEVEDPEGDYQAFVVELTPCMDRMANPLAGGTIEELAASVKAAEWSFGLNVARSFLDDFLCDLREQARLEAIDREEWMRDRDNAA